MGSQSPRFPAERRNGFILQRTRDGHRQSDEHWNRFKDNAGETSEREDGAHMGFSERIDTILNRTESTEAALKTRVLFNNDDH